MRDWRTLIVEDDPVVADVHRRLVAGVDGFVVVGTATSAEDAMRMISLTRPHLLLLDLTLPGHSGIDLLRALRRRREPVEAIAVTASREADVVRETAHLGVIDYLVKPFTPERLGEALVRFRHRVTAVEHLTLDQRDVDRVYGADRGRRWLPKDLAPETLELVRAALCDNPDPRTADELAEAVGIARVTARRYLEYLLTTREAIVEHVGSGPGRPRKAYRPADESGREP
jgi:response regulator of citrate/malate metabolism